MEFNEIKGFPNWTVAPLPKSLPRRVSVTRFPCVAEAGATEATTGRAHPVTSFEYAVLSMPAVLYAFTARYHVLQSATPVTVAEVAYPTSRLCVYVPGELP
jgi:hypothetical protein